MGTIVCIQTAVISMLQLGGSGGMPPGKLHAEIQFGGILQLKFVISSRTLAVRTFCLHFFLTIMIMMNVYNKKKTSM